MIVNVDNFGSGSLLEYLTLSRIGILLGIIETGFLAFSVKAENQYSNFKEIQSKLKEWKKIGIFSPSDVSINRGLLWTGLGLVAIGSLLQW